MKIKELITKYLLPIKLEHGESFVLGAGKYTTVPIDVNTATPGMPEEASHFPRLRDAILNGELADGVYFSLCTYDTVWPANKPNTPGYQGVLRQSSNARRFIAWAADDVGEAPNSKVHPDRFHDIPPTFIVETSPKNYHYIFVLEVPVENLKMAYAFMVQAKDLGLTDAGGTQATKLMRLPTGINKRFTDEKGNFFKCRLAACSGRKWSFMDLASRLGMDVEALANMKNAKVGRAAENVIGLDTNDLSEASKKIRDMEMARNKWGDYLLARLLDTDMILTPTDEIEACAETPQGWINMKCPWADEHTGAGHKDSKTDAGFSPVGFGEGDYELVNAFHCFHGTCANRGIQHLVEWAKEQGMIDDADLVADVKINFDKKLAEVLTYYAFSRENEKVYDMRDPHRPPASMTYIKNVDLKPYRSDKGRALYNAWTESFDLVQLAGTDYVPGQPAKVEDGYGQLRFNLWTSPDRRPSPCSDRVRQLLDLHFSNGTDDAQQEHILKTFLASSVIHPELRLRFAMIWMSYHFGIGKGIACQLVRKLIGRDNYKKVTATQIIKSNFNDWAVECTFLEIPEFKLPSARAQASDMVYDQFYEVISEDRLEIDTKNVRSRQEYLWCNIIGCTNHPNAAAIKKHDRRLAVVSCSNPAPGADHFLEFGELLEDEAQLCEALGYFKDIDEEHGAQFRNLTRAPFTDAKADMVEASAEPVDKALEALMTEGRHELVWPSELLVVAIKEHCRRAMNINSLEDEHPNRVMIKAQPQLTSMGLVQCTRSRRKYLHGRKVMFWSQPSSKWNREQLAACITKLIEQLPEEYQDTITYGLAWLRGDKKF